MSNLKDKICYFYLRNIKRKMVCPVCGGILSIRAKDKKWSCKACEYSLDEELFKNDYTFWFCDNYDCGAFLNKQKDFCEKQGTWICTECRHNNILSFELIERIKHEMVYNFAGFEFASKRKVGGIDFEKFDNFWRIEIWYGEVYKQYEFYSKDEEIFKNLDEMFDEKIFDGKSMREILTKQKIKWNWI